MEDEPIIVDGAVGSDSASSGGARRPRFRAGTGRRIADLLDRSFEIPATEGQRITDPVSGQTLSVTPTKVISVKSIALAAATTLATAGLAQWRANAPYRAQAGAAKKVHKAASKARQGELKARERELAIELKAEAAFQKLAERRGSREGRTAALSEHEPAADQIPALAVAGGDGAVMADLTRAELLAQLESGELSAVIDPHTGEVAAVRRSAANMPTSAAPAQQSTGARLGRG